MPDNTKVDPLEALAAEEAADADIQQADSETARGGAAPAQTAPQPIADAPPAEEDAAADPPWAQHGFKNPEAVYDAWRNASQKINQQGEELGQLRQFQRQAAPLLEQMQYQQQFGQQQPQQEVLPDGSPVYDMATLQQAVEDGHLSEFQAMAIYADQQATVRAADMVKEIVSQRLAPLEATAVDRGARDTLDALNKEVGDDVVARHADLIGRLITDDRAHYADPRHGTRRLAESIKAAEWDYQHGVSHTPAPPRTQRSEAENTYVEGGSSAQPPVVAGGTPMDPEEQALAQSLNMSFQRPVDEMGIPLPQR